VIKWVLSPEEVMSRWTLSFEMGSVLMWITVVMFVDTILIHSQHPWLLSTNHHKSHLNTLTTSTGRMNAD
jgi:hypothetical protein